MKLFNIFPSHVIKGNTVKTISMLEAKEGMELGEHVEVQGMIVYSAGTLLDKKAIDRLNRYGIMTINIMEPVDYAKTHYERIQYNENFKKFVDKYQFCLTSYKGIMISYLGMKPKISIEKEDLLKLYYDCNSMVSTGGQLLDYIYNMMPNEDELTYTNSFNAALLCGTFANWLDLSQEDKELLILCGFYYDIGKWTLSNDILWKPGKLTEEELTLVKKHPVIGYALVRDDTNLNEHIKNTIIMHHERMDGSGYPYHMKGEKIDLFARYLAIVDTYVSMASPRSFRPAFTPLQILGNFEKNMGIYDVSILMPLMDHIADAQIGTQVELSDHTTWEVAMVNKTSYGRPILKNDHNEIMDLSTRSTLDIVKYL